MSEPLILEFVGLSGAGKSTAAEALQEILRSRGYRCAHRHMIGGRELPRSEHYRRLTLYLVTHPGVLLAAARLGLPTVFQGPSRWREALRFHVWSYRLVLARKLRCDIVILDQGVVQEAWGLMVRQSGWRRSDLEAAAHHVIAGVKAPYALISFQVDRGLAARRIAGRTQGESRFDEMSESETARLLASYDPVLQTMQEQLGRALGLPTLVVDGARPVQELAAEIADFAEARLRSAS